MTNNGAWKQVAVLESKLGPTDVHLEDGGQAAIAEIRDLDATRNPRLWVPLTSWVDADEEDTELSLALRHIEISQMREKRVRITIEVQDNKS